MELHEPSLSDLMERLGPQRRTDDPLLRRVRLHQSWYRAEVLGLTRWGSVPSARATPLGSILTEADAESGYNFVSPDARAAYEARRLTGWGVDPVRCQRYMTSSQALTLNLLGPLLADANWCAATLSLVTGKIIQRVVRGYVEYAPKERIQVMGDKTIADGFFELTTSAGPTSLVVETKFADGFTARDLNVARNPRYLALNDDLMIWNTDSAYFGAGKFDQLARIHALGSMSGGSRATLLVIHHPEDRRTPTIAKNYSASLIDPSTMIVTDTKLFVGAMKAAALSPAQVALADELDRRFNDHELSETAWRAASARVRKLASAHSKAD